MLTTAAVVTVPVYGDPPLQLAAFVAVLLLSVRVPENVPPDCVSVHVELQVAVTLCVRGLTTALVKVTVPVQVPASEGNTGAPVPGAAGLDDEQLMVKNAHTPSTARFINASF